MVATCRDFLTAPLRKEVEEVKAQLSAERTARIDQEERHARLVICELGKMKKEIEKRVDGFLLQKEEHFRLLEVQLATRLKKGTLGLFYLN